MKGKILLKDRIKSLNSISFPFVVEGGGHEQTRSTNSDIGEINSKIWLPLTAH